MAYNLSQGNKDIDADIFSGFGAPLSGFMPHSYNVNDGVTGLEHDPFDHHALSLQPDDDSLQTPYFTLNSNFNPPPSSSNDTNDNTSTSHSTFSQLSPTSHQEHNMMQFPGYHHSINANNPSPGSTASTSSLHQIQPKLESNPLFDPLTMQQHFEENNNEYFNEYLNTSLNMKHSNINRIKHEPKMYDRVINEFMNDYHNDKQHHKEPNDQWMFGTVPFVPPSYTNSNTNGLCENIPVNTSPLPPIPPIPPIPLSVPPNYAYYPQQQMHPIVHESIDNRMVASPKYIKASSPGNNAKKYECKQCSKKFKHHSNLKIHLIVHTDKALVCGYCSKKFARKTNLKQHERVHTGERPFECNICKRKFKQKHSLKDHIKIHTGEKPFICQFCNKSFKIKHNLTLHIRTHTGEKPHQCSMCLTAFQCQKDLKKHQYQCGAPTAVNVMPILDI